MTAENVHSETALTFLFLISAKVRSKGTMGKAVWAVLAVLAIAAACSATEVDGTAFTLEPGLEVGLEVGGYPGLLGLRARGL